MRETKKCTFLHALNITQISQRLEFLIEQTRFGQTRSLNLDQAGCKIGHQVTAFWI